MALDQQAGAGAGQNGGSPGHNEPGSYEEFIASVPGDLAKGMMSPRVFNDTHLHAEEMKKIFTKCWIFVGHVSEIASPGDYVLRSIGEDQFIVTRDEDGEIQVLLNSCVHRAATICRAERGNTSHFRCPYHGWIYRNSGAWNGAPHLTKAYRKLDRKEWGLRKAPHVDTYQGLIFACLDPGAMPLKDYLGDMCWYLDVMFDIDPKGMSVVGDPHRWVVDANWKSGAETFVGDAYHLPNLHRSGEEIGAIPSIDAILETEFQIMVDGGHGMQGHRGVLPEPLFGILDFPADVIESTFDLSKLDDKQRDFLENKYGITVFTIFPNLSFLRAPGTTDPRLRPPTVYTSLRQFQPKGPSKMEMWNWPMEFNSAPEEFNRMAYEAGVHAFSPSGIVEQDDTVVWAGGPPTGRGLFARDGMKLNFNLGLEGMSDCEIRSDWPYPGDATSSAYTEFGQRAWWTHWHSVVTA